MKKKKTPLKLHPELQFDYTLTQAEAWSIINSVHGANFYTLTQVLFPYLQKLHVKAVQYITTDITLDRLTTGQAVTARHAHWQHARSD